MPVNTIGRLCGLNASLPKPTRLPIIGAHQPGDRGVDVHNGAAGEVQRAWVASRPPPQTICAIGT